MARTPKVRRGDGAAPARTFVVRLAATSDESTGHLVVRAPDGSTAEREVVGDTCEEVVAALALVAALAVDPNATTRAMPIPAPARPRPAAVVASPAPVPRAAPPAAARGAVSLDGLVATGVAPAPLVGAALAVAAAGPRRGWLAPTVRLGIAAASSGTVDVTGGKATFTSLTGALDVCPGDRLLGRWSLTPCVRVEGGVLSAAGADVVAPRTDAHPWGAAGALARAERRLPGGFFLELSGGARVPFVRTTFFFEPDVTIFRTAPVSGEFSAGLGLRFL
jgi:hypothetical protein